MGKVIAICNQKGGVGKTTTTAAMGAALAEKGYKTILIDCDDSGNPSLTKALSSDESKKTTLTDLMLFRILGRDIDEEIKKTINTHNEGFDYLPADNELPGIANVLNSADEKKKRLILKDITNMLKEKYDYIILDAAPALNIISLNVLAAADEIILTSQPQGAAEQGLLELLNTAVNIKNTVNTALTVKGLLITMVDSRTNYNKDKANKMINEYTDRGMKVFTTQIPRAVVAESWVEHKKSIISYAPDSKPAIAYRNFVNEYLAGQQLENKH